MLSEVQAHSSTVFTIWRDSGQSAAWYPQTIQVLQQEQ